MNRRGFLLIAIMFLLAGAALLVMTSVRSARASRVSQRLILRDVQRNSDFRSALQIILSELSQASSDILNGNLPELKEQYEIHSDGKEEVVVRLARWNSGSVVVSENARLYLNEATESGLSSIPGIDEQLAGLIIKSRNNLPLDCVTKIDDIKSDLPFSFFYGDDPIVFAERDESLISGENFDYQAALAPVDWLTVYSLVKNVRRDGDPRVDLNQSYSQEELDTVFGFETLFKKGSQEYFSAHELMDRTDQYDYFPVDLGIFGNRVDPLAPYWYMFPGSSAKVSFEENDVERASGLGLHLPSARKLPDTFTTFPMLWIKGRLDLLRAPSEIIQAVLEVSEKDALRLISAREGMPPQERAWANWPMVMIEGFRNPSWARKIIKTTTRPWMVRVLGVVGRVSKQDVDGRISAPKLFEAVFDLTGVPRIAMLKDVTWRAIGIRRFLANGKNAEGPFRGEKAKFYELNDESSAKEEEMGGSVDSFGEYQYRPGRWLK